MAGIATGLGSIQEVGYTASKHGVVSFTRSFGTSKPNVYHSEGIKAYAICPFFADTNLVKESININDLTKRIKTRVLTVEEVGHAMEMSLKNDENGACWVVFPDCPPFVMPDVNLNLCKAMIGFGQKIAGPMSLETFNGKHFFAFVFIFLACFYYFLGFIF